MSLEDKRAYIKIGGGNETEVWKSVRDGREGWVVIKDMEGLLDDKEKEKIEKYFNKIKEIYGADLFPVQRIVKAGPGSNEVGERYVLLQKKIEVANPSDVFGYTSDTLPLNVKQRLKKLVDDLKVSYQEYLEMGNSNNRPFLDLYGQNNLVVTKDNELCCIDTGPIMVNIGAESDEEDAEEAIHCMVSSKIAILDLLLEPQKDLFDDKMYKGLYSYCADIFDKDDNFPTDFNSEDPQTVMFFLKNLNKYVFDAKKRLEEGELKK